MDIILVSYIILSLGAIQGFILSFFLMGSTSKSSKGNLILGLVLFFFSLNMIVPGVLFYFYEDFYHLLAVGFPVMFLFGPGIYLYTLIKTGWRDKFRISDLAHLIPFIISFLLTFPLYLKSAEAKIMILEDWRQGYLANEILLGWAVECIHLSIYMVISFKILRKFKEKVRQTLSSIETVNLTWLQQFVGLKSVVWSLYFILLIAYLFGLKGQSFNYTFFIFGLSVSTLTYFMGYKGLHRPEIFLPKSLTETAKVKYRKSGLSEQMIKIYLTELEGLTLREKPYRESDLTLPDLTQRLDVPPNYLSQVINERIGYNFFDYINSLRINDAKKLLTDAQYIDQSVMQMACWI